MSDLISVIIPVYNVEAYLPRCINSVLSQIYENLEIFLVDDGSPDACGAICDDYAAKDPRITVIHKKNGGLSDARNAALNVCTGEYVTFIDSDDYVSSDHIESLYHAIHAHHTKLAISGIIKFNAFGSEYADYVPSDTEKIITGAEMAETVWRPAACNKLYHRSLFDGIRYPFGKLYEDLFIYHDILARVDCISLTGKNTYFYFDRQDSIMNRKYDIRNTDSVEGIDLRLKKLRALRYGELADRHLPILFNETIDAFDKIDHTNDEGKKRLITIKAIFNEHFKEMMLYAGFSFPQKAKIALFRISPRIYTKFFRSGI